MNMKPVLLLFPKTGGHKLRAQRQNDSTAEFYCFQRNTNGNEAHLISSSVETYSLVQDIEPPTDCEPKEVNFRSEFPKQLKLRCLSFGSNEPKIVVTKSTIKKKRKRFAD
ncbi:unnamed protein product [Rotaria sordida]|uniref:Uncharacterized protein n=1 Tax=Rotaria sordida TaxID=392033 RepID=A0A818K997_9BILA|nr:unnamed protein product [Rotaria sordida]CAF3550895.1 unnamed protein product [Rotaria sordida]